MPSLLVSGADGGRGLGRRTGGQSVTAEHEAGKGLLGMGCTHHGVAGFRHDKQRVPKDHDMDCDFHVESPFRKWTLTWGVACSVARCLSARKLFRGSMLVSTDLVQWLDAGPHEKMCSGMRIFRHRATGPNQHRPPSAAEASSWWQGINVGQCTPLGAH